jgi:23S rRNA (uridine2552-2'-O)-methyltransferase
MKKSKTSGQWLKEHEDDKYVKLVRQEGYRSRASYKLLEINEKFSLLKPGAVVVDLGAAPGGWLQVAVNTVGAKGKVVGLDLLEIEPVAGASFIQGDFTENEPLEQLLAELEDRPVDLVLSDMAPNLSGMSDIDQPKSVYLIELALEFSDTVLKKGGNLVTKCFEGAGIESLRSEFRQRFSRVSNFKPKASRDRSREIYVIGQSYKRR